MKLESRQTAAFPSMNKYLEKCNQIANSRFDVINHSGGAFEKYYNRVELLHPRQKSGISDVGEKSVSGKG